MAQRPSAAMEPLPADLKASIGEDERVLFAVRPGLLFIVATSWRTIAVLGIAGVIFFAVPGLQWRWGPLVSVVFALARLGWALAVWWNVRAVLTDRRVCVASGVFRRAVTSLKLEHIQHVALSKLFVERLLGLGTVAMFSSGSGYADVVWPMLNTPGSVQALLRETIQRAKSGNTDAPEGWLA